MDHDADTALPTFVADISPAIDYGTLEWPGKHLGSGGLGEVSLCKVTNCDGARVLVVAKLVDVDSDENRRAATNEAAAMHALCVGEHPALPVFLASCNCDAGYLLFMQPFSAESRGTTLFEAIDQAARARYLAHRSKRNIWTPLGRRAIERVIEVLVDALAYIHRAGYAHRDVKPENVLYDADTKRIQLIDYGGTMDAERLEHSRDLLFGTSMYLAAELHPKCQNPFVLTVDDFQRGDLFALGITVYELALLRTFDDDMAPYKSSQLRRARRIFEEIAKNGGELDAAYALLEWPLNVHLGDVQDPRLTRLVGSLCVGNPFERPASADDIKF